ncbi:hypothetical protein EJ110_NYTH30206 [Nymphaea thermarum]|nr:hypothetical protein EJ110_NYTH30206 [Nymphaea thermarum]
MANVSLKSAGGGGGGGGVRRKEGFRLSHTPASRGPIPRLASRLQRYIFGEDDDTLPWTEASDIADLDEVPELEEEDTATMSLLSALMQSGLQENVGIGIALLADALKDCSSRLKRTRVLCLLALEYRRQGRYSKSHYFIEQASKELPLLKKVFHLEDVAYHRMMKGDQIIKSFAAIAAMLFAGGCFILGIKKFSRLDRRGK